MNKLKLALMMAALLSSTTAFAQDKKIEATSKASTTQSPAKQDNLAFLNKVTGINDDQLKIKNRSKKEGAKADIVVFFPEDPTIQELGLDENDLAKDINIYHKQVADYFKKNPKYKGAFLSFFTFYPGYTKAYQYPIDPKNKDLSETLNLTIQNKKLAELSDCNSEKFCGLLVLHKSKFATKDEKLQFSDDQLEKHLDTYNTEQIKHYPSKKDNLKPMHFITIMGTNGFKVSDSDALTLVNLAMQDRL